MAREIQRLRLQALKERHREQGQDLVQILMQILQLDKSAIYKRLDGSKLLDLEEIRLVTEKLRLAPDYFTGGSEGMVAFDLSAMRSQPSSVMEFLSPIRENLEVLEKRPQAHITYASNDIPLFNYFHYPELAWFKFYVWGRTVWGFKGWVDQPFDTGIIIRNEKGNVAGLVKDLATSYSRIPSTEYWNFSILENTLNQVRYHQELGNFREEETPYRLLEQLREMTLLLERQAGNGRKEGDGGANFQLLHNEIIQTNNTILLEDEGKPVRVFATFDNPNFMYSTDPGLCHYTRRWFDKLRTGSTMLTVAGSRQRAKYFRGLRNRIDQMQETIRALA